MPNPLFREAFDAPTLITNEFAHWNPKSVEAIRSQTWDVTSGSLFLRDGAGWSGVSDGQAPGPHSATATGSAVFRAVTQRRDFADVTVRTGLRVDRLVSTARTPAVAWDGIHLFPRYVSEQELYYASVCRRDGTLILKKKTPGGPSNGGTYHDLGVLKGAYPIPFGRWRQVEAAVRTRADGAVVLSLEVPGQRLVATDTGVGGPPITGPGRVGIRGDNAEFRFRDFAVYPHQPITP